MAHELDIVDKAVLRYCTNAEHARKVDRVILTLQAEKHTELDADEQAAVVISVGVHILLEEAAND